MFVFLNTILLIGRSWDTRYFRFYLYFNATSIIMSLESKGSQDTYRSFGVTTELRRLRGQRSHLNHAE